MKRIWNLAPVLLFSLTACGLTGGSGDGDGSEPGQETGPCIDARCFEGLVCLSELCVDPDSADSDGDSGSSQTSPGSTSGPSSSGTSADSTTSGSSCSPGDECQSDGDCDGGESCVACVCVNGTATSPSTDATADASESDSDGETGPQCPPGSECQGDDDCAGGGVCIACNCIGGVCTTPECNNCGTCQECVECMGAPGGDCQSEIAACEADADCTAIFECALRCATPDLACIEGCSLGFEGGLSLFNPALQCVLGNLIVPDGKCAGPCI